MRGLVGDELMLFSLLGTNEWLRALRLGRDNHESEWKPAQTSAWSLNHVNSAEIRVFVPRLVPGGRVPQNSRMASITFNFFFSGCLALSCRLGPEDNVSVWVVYPSL